MDLLSRAKFLYADKVSRLRRFPKEDPTDTVGRALTFTSRLRYHAELSILQQLVREAESGVLEKLQQPGFSGLATLNLELLDTDSRRALEPRMTSDASPSLSPS